MRANIQRKATKGSRCTRRRCRELLKRLSGKGKRFQTLVNHTISHRIVTEAKNKNQVVALEDLTGIRERTNQQPRSKKERRRFNNWAFFQLRQFLIYKAIKHRVKILFVEPS
ncbi:MULTISPECIES: IS200/IS605 family accessory protein TnpB-related protein [unclassified Microcoleus]|uniref:IS200/IS605 family accessory protein TnpB-related protein n=1 Tax=unclassified Microcoleus TaxID=2642155 RepID=UPI00403F73A8